MKKDVTFKFRVNKSEKDFLKELAKKMDKDMSKVVRIKLFGEEK